MSLWPRIWRTRKRELEIDEEIQAHLNMAERDRQEFGLPPDAAAAGAAREFGNRTLIAEITREIWGWPSVERLVQDVRYSFRTVRRHPAFAAVAVLSLALGIGANTTAFSLADAALLRPLAVADPSSLVAISTRTPQQAVGDLSNPDLEDLRSGLETIDGLVGSRTARVAMARPADTVPQVRFALLVTRGFFDVLGVPPVLGRDFSAGELTLAGEPVVILSDETWRSQFGADPGVLGTTVRINELAATVVGVAPRQFRGINQFLRPALYMPVTLEPRLNPGRPSLLDDRSVSTMIVRGRLKPGASIPQAQAELTLLGRRLEHAYPATNAHREFVVRTEFAARVAEAPPTILIVGLLLTVSALVFIIACANVASLLLARARARSREVALRLAIGAGPVRLMRQLLTESGVLALGGGLLGVAFAVVVIGQIAKIELPTDTPIGLAVQLDGRVLLFSLAVSMLSALVLGVVPAWKTSRADLAHTMKAGEAVNQGGARPWGRQALVAGQVALCVVLLVTALALVDAFRRMVLVDPGLRTDRLVTVEFDPRLVGYDAARTAQFYKLLLERARALRGVENVTVAAALPFRPSFAERDLVPEGYQLPRDQSSVRVVANVVGDRYFSTVGTPILQGREFVEADAAGSRLVAVVNEEFAARYWPGSDPIGRRVRLATDGPTAEVVGLARNAKYLSLAETPQPYMYLPYAQHPRSRMTLMAASADPLAVLTPLLEAVRRIDPNQPVFNVRDFRSYFEGGALGLPRMLLRIVSAAGLLGLGLALVGLYGLVSYAVSLRTREIGIRIAIGASRGAILRLVAGQGTRLSLVGSLTGVALSVPLFRLLSANMVGLGGLSPWTLVVVPIALMGVTVCACLIPARRAARVDPTIALRND